MMHVSGVIHNSTSFLAEQIVFVCGRVGKPLFHLKNVDMYCTHARAHTHAAVGKSLSSSTNAEQWLRLKFLLNTHT